MIENHITPTGFDLNAYTQELSAMPYEKQMKKAETDMAGNEFIKTRTTGTTATSYEDRIIFQADVIEASYLKYLERSRHCPEQCLDTLKIELAEKLIEAIG